MDEKIKEVMELVDEYLDSKIKNGSYTYNEKTYCARLAIETKLRELVKIPPGYALVPVEPTEAMARAFRADDAPHYFVMTTIRCADFSERYAAMLAAAQKEIK